MKENILIGVSIFFMIFSVMIFLLYLRAEENDAIQQVRSDIIKNLN